MSTLSREELEKKLESFVGLEIGEPELAGDAVNEAMIRHWCEAMGDTNPIYTDAAAAEASVHGGIVAPPSMLQAWMLRGIDMANPDSTYRTKQTELHDLFNANGYTGVVATNCVQSYTRYLRPGDRIESTTVIESISEQKATGLGIGYFINTRETFRDQNGEDVGWQTFRVLKFTPAEQPQAAAEDTAGTPSKPTRFKAPLGHDNTWWWDGVNDGKVLIQKCSGCGTLRHPARPMCGECQSLEWQAVEAKGTGTIYSYTVLHHPKFPGYDFPLACALVDLDEGVRMVANVQGCEPDQLEIGMPVVVSVEQVDDDTKLPVFRPAE
jgi:uncharacterized OB-fold protein/acyl dehydratase